MSLKWYAVYAYIFVHVAYTYAYMQPQDVRYARIPLWSSSTSSRPWRQQPSTMPSRPLKLPWRWSLLRPFAPTKSCMVEMLPGRWTSQWLDFDLVAFLNPIFFGCLRVVWKRFLFFNFHAFCDDFDTLTHTSMLQTSQWFFGGIYICFFWVMFWDILLFFWILGLWLLWLLWLLASLAFWFLALGFCGFVGFFRFCAFAALLAFWLCNKTEEYNQQCNNATMQAPCIKHSNHIIDHKARVGSGTDVLACILQIACKTSKKDCQTQTATKLTTRTRRTTAATTKAK